MTAQNAGYRKSIVSNETQMEAYSTEVSDLRKNFTIQKSENDRLKDEVAAYKKQTQKLIEDIKAIEGGKDVER
jgi:cell division protein FtsL